MSEKCGLLVSGGKLVGTIPLPPGTRDTTLPQPPLPEGTTPFHLTPRPDGLAVDTSPESYAQKRWSPSRWNPFRKAWPELAEFDDRVQRLEERQQDTIAELHGMTDQLPLAEAADRDAMASWVLDNAGERPLPTVPALAQKLAELERERDGFDAAIRTVLDQKEKFVVANRSRLRKEAAKSREAASSQLRAAISKLEQARDEVVASVSAEAWALAYPSQDADAAGLRMPLVKGGRLAKAIPEFRGLLAATQITALLHEDAEWLNGVIEQQQQDKDGDADVRDQAVWESTKEGQKAREAERMRVIEGLAPRNVRQAGWDA